METLEKLYNFNKKQHYAICHCFICDRRLFFLPLYYCPQTFFLTKLIATQAGPT